MLNEFKSYFFWLLFFVLLGLGAQFIIFPKSQKLHYDLESSLFWKAYPKKVKAFHDELLNIPELNQKVGFASLEHKKIVKDLKSKTWVDYAKIKKTLLGRVYLKVKVAEPEFLWIGKVKSHLVSAEGQKIVSVNSDQWPDLPIVRGAWDDLSFQSLGLLMKEFEKLPEALNHKSVSEVWNQAEYWKVQMNESYQILIPKKEFAVRLLRIKEVYEYLRGKNIPFSLLDSRFDKKILARK